MYWSGRLNVAELCVVAWTHRDMAAGQLGHGCGGVVDEGAVMRNQHHAALEGDQEPLEPLHRVQVEMVGRLVKQEQIRFAEQHAGQRHPHLFTAGQ